MITADEVVQAYELTEPAQAWLTAVVGSVNAYVATLPDITTVTTVETIDGVPVETTTWGAETKLGALMLAARLYDRRDSRGGVINLGESVSYVSRYDSDIARLLHLDTYTKPKVA
nr:MAG TPA_asm: head to tail adaptor [Caudoviricetes sp.]